ncbi:MAG: translation initiation factor IF-2 [bacterium]|nr:translation initiation factor IF-2 [bacterium]
MADKKTTKIKKEEKDTKKKTTTKKKTVVAKKTTSLKQKDSGTKAVKKKSTTKKVVESKSLIKKPSAKKSSTSLQTTKKSETKQSKTKPSEPKKKVTKKLTVKKKVSSTASKVKTNKKTDAKIEKTTKVKVVKSRTKESEPKKVEGKKEEKNVSVYKPNFQRKQQGSTKNRKKYKKEKRVQAKAQAEQEAINQEETANIIEVKEALTVNMIAENMGVQGAEIITKLMGMGVLATLNQRIDNDTASVLADEYGYKLKYISVDDLADLVDEEYSESDLEKRSPVITIMGHVDHGKTSLLDAIRKSDVVSGEAGGITQHIGAYQVHTDQGLLTFLDTPGHAAFTAMRARGAEVTDIVVIVVAADDGVMPQTIEGIDHAKAAGVPIIVAVNKMDVADANPDKVMQELGGHGLVPEEWGGNTIVVKVSAIEKTGIVELLEMIALQSDMMELKAAYIGKAQGVIVEAELDKKRGPIATVLVQQGTLKQGDPFIAGTVFGKVKLMTNDKGKHQKNAGPSSAVGILGFNSVPNAGDLFRVLNSEKEAKQVAEKRREAFREERLSRRKHLTLESLQLQMLAGEVKEFNVILKADVRGSVEALKDSLERLSTDEVKLNVIHYGVGSVTESDIMLAVASEALIFSFNLTISTMVNSIAEQEGVEIREYQIIYEIIEEVKAAMEGLLTPSIEQELIGKSEVRQVIRIPKIGVIAGSMVTEGKVARDAIAKVYREDVLQIESTVTQLKRFKENVKEVEKGFECGISVEGFETFQEGDILEFFKEKEILRKLDS